MVFHMNRKKAGNHQSKKFNESSIQSMRSIKDEEMLIIYVWCPFSSWSQCKLVTIEMNLGLSIYYCVLKEVTKISWTFWQHSIGEASEKS